MSGKAPQPGTNAGNQIAVGILSGLVTLGTLVGVIYCGLLFVAQFSGALYYFLERLPKPLEPLLWTIRNMVGRVAGMDLAPLIAAVLVLGAGVILLGLLAPHPPRGAAPPVSGRANAQAAIREAPRAGASFSQGMGTSLHGRPLQRASHLELLEFIALKKREIEKAVGKEREALQAEIREAQQALAAKKKNLAFLAADVVGSTKMKTGQHSVIVEHAFLAFRKWANAIMEKHGVWKSSWTPDGVMAAFKDVDAAAAAAREILRELPKFNKEENQMDVPIRLRLGVSHGQVMFDDEARMDEVSDQVIDLAGHLQKYAEPNTLLMTQRDHAKLRDRSGFRSANRQVDGFDVLEWQA